MLKRESGRRRDSPDMADVTAAVAGGTGAAAAVRAALALANGDVTVIQDADLEYDPQDLIRMVVPLADGRADAVLACREALDLNANVLLAVEQLALALRAG